MKPELNAKSILGIVLGLGSLAIGYFAGAALGRAEYARNAAEKLAHAAMVSTNKQTPMQLDRETVLDNALAMGRQIVYQATIKSLDPRAPAFAQLERTQRRLLVNRVCTTRETAFLLSKGVTFAYIYRDASGRELFRVSIQASDCKSSG